MKTTPHTFGSQLSRMAILVIILVTLQLSGCADNAQEDSTAPSSNGELLGGTSNGDNSNGELPGGTSNNTSNGDDDCGQAPCVEGATRCSGDGVEICDFDENGCFEWTQAESCGARQACDDSGDDAHCICADACTAGTTSCVDTAVVACITDADGCAYLDNEDSVRDCALGSPAQTCAEEDGSAFCLAPPVSITSTDEGISLESVLDGAARVWNRPDENCQPGDGGDYLYEAWHITNATAQAQSITATATWTTEGDNGYLHAFRGSFEATSLQGCLMGNDDLGDRVEVSRLGGLNIAPGESLVFIASTHTPETTPGEYTLAIVTSAACHEEPWEGDYVGNGEDLLGYPSVTGNMLLERLEAAELAPLTCLQHIEGNLNIEGNGVLRDLDALSNLTSIAGNVVIDSNPALTNLMGFSSLVSVGGDMNIAQNDALRSLGGLSSLTTIGGDLNMGRYHDEFQFRGDPDSPQLNTLEGLSSLTSVESLNFVNTSLVTFEGLSNLTHIENGLTLDDNGALVNLMGLAALVSVSGDVNIVANEALSNLDGLSNLTTIGGNLNINRNSVLEHLDGLQNITALGGLSISRSPLLENLDAFSELTVIEGPLLITENNTLGNIDALHGLTTIGGDVSLGFNSALVLSSSGGLSNITSIGGNLTIAHNGVWTSIDGFPNLASVGGDLVFNSNAMLADLDGLSSLTAIGGGLFLNNNRVLADLSGLSNVTALGGSLEITGGNDRLRDLDGLTSLTAIDGDVILTANEGFNTNALRNIDGLANVASIGGEVSIYDATRLEDVDGLSGLVSIGGGLEIWGSSALRNLDGFVNLTALGGDLNIIDNGNLVAVDGLSNLTFVGAPDTNCLNADCPDLTISFNRALCTSDANALVEQLQANIEPNLTARVESNNTSCR